MQRATWIRTALFFSVLVAASTGLAVAQTNDDSNGGVQFNFSTPGARSLAMGGSFLGSVDDATAAYSNPAGLVQLSETEVSVEGRRWNYSTPFADRGRTGGSLTGIGVDTISGVQYGTAGAELDGVSFASVVIPRNKWAFAFYFHQVAKFYSEFSTGGIFLSNSRLLPVHSTYDLDITQSGFALAHQGEQFAIGIGVSLYSFELGSLTQRYVWPRSPYASVSFVPENAANYQTQDGSPEEVGFTIGVRWDVSEKTSFGAVYRFGPEFDINVLSATGSPGSTIDIGVNDVAIFNLPDVIGAGYSFHPNQSLTFNLDFNLVAYSDMVKDFFIIFEEDPEDYVIDDVVETHVGFEYVMSKGPIPIAFRLGAWHDPDHRLRYEGASESEQTIFFEGEDQIHYTAGIGLVLTSHIQLDAAADISDISDTIAVSFAYRF